MLHLAHSYMKSRVWSSFVRTVLAIASLAFCLVATHYSFVEVARFVGRAPVFVWGVFHYSLNAKYFPELQYTHLYDCAVEAQREIGKPYIVTETVRDLVTYELVEVQQARPCPRERFREDRWRQFVADVDGFRREIDAYPLTEERKHTYWAGIIMDKGYNAPPTHVVISQILVRISEAFGAWGYAFLASIDIVGALLAIVVVWRAFGRKAVYWGLLVTFMFWGTAGHLVGHFLQHIWLAALVCMLAALKRERWVVAGGCLAFAVTTRVFPVVFILPFAWRLAIVFQQKESKECANLTRIMISFVGCSTIFVGLGLFSGLGAEGWQLFFEKMRMHSAYLTGELFDTGWKTLITGFLPAENSDFARIAAFGSYVTLIMGGAFGLSLLLLYRHRFAGLPTLLLLCLPMTYLLVVVSPFYWLMYALIPLLVLGWSSDLWQRTWLQRFALGVLVGILFFQTRYVVSGLEFTDLGLAEHRLDATLHFLANACVVLLVEGSALGKTVSVKTTAA